MDWTALGLSLRLAAWTVAILLPVGVLLGRFLARARFRGRSLLEAVVALPLVLPPTVLGYYLLEAFGARSTLGSLYASLAGRTLAFSFEGLLLASVLFNLPFAVQPMRRAFAGIPGSVLEAADCCGLSPWRRFRRIELPLAWPGILGALVVTFAHTLGEFGVVLMVGGNIPGETRTVAIAIYDRTQALDPAGAGTMALALLAISLCAIALSYTTARDPHA